MIWLLTHAMTLIVGVVIGAYGWFRYGNRLRADLQKVETAVTSFTGKGNKASGK